MSYRRDSSSAASVDATNSDNFSVPSQSFSSLEEKWAASVGLRPSLWEPNAIKETAWQNTSPASHWARISLAYVQVRRRPARFLAAVISCVIVLLLLHSSFSVTSLLSSDIAEVASTNFTSRGHHIPPNIWQVIFTKPHPDPVTGRKSYDFDPDLIKYTNSWIARNPDYNYKLVATEYADRFVRRHFSLEKNVMDVHFGLRNHGPRSDIMRYMLMFVEGGVYSDTDVTCLKPVDTWIPAKWRNEVKAVVGIEGDSLGGDIIAGMLWDVQFGQWTCVQDSSSSKTNMG